MKWQYLSPVERRNLERSGTWSNTRGYKANMFRFGRETTGDRRFRGVGIFGQTVTDPHPEHRFWHRSAINWGATIPNWWFLERKTTWNPSLFRSKCDGQLGESALMLFLRTEWYWLVAVVAVVVVVLVCFPFSNFLFWWLITSLMLLLLLLPSNECACEYTTYIDDGFLSKLCTSKPSSNTWFWEVLGHQNVPQFGRALVPSLLDISIIQDSNTYCHLVAQPQQ